MLVCSKTLSIQCIFFYFLHEAGKNVNQPLKKITESSLQSDLGHSTAASRLSGIPGKTIEMCLG